MERKRKEKAMLNRQRIEKQVIEEAEADIDFIEVKAPMTDREKAAYKAAARKAAVRVCVAVGMPDGDFKANFQTVE